MMARPIRVLQVLGSLEYGGAESMVMNLYRKIDRNIVEFDFIVHSSEEGAFEEEVREYGGHIIRCPKFNGKNISEYKSWWRNFFREHKQYRILHSHIRSTASLFFPIAKKYGLKTIIHSHSTSEGRGVKAAVKRALEYPLRYQADIFIACSEASGKWLFGRRVVGSNRFHILNNAIDTEKYQFKHEIYCKYREELNLNHSFVVIHIGRFHESKNHMYLLHIFSELLKAVPESTLLLVGDGSLRNEIEKEIDELHLVDHVRILGNRDDIANLLMCSDTFVFPSRWEGFPVSVIEAQASGICCFVSDRITPKVAVTNRIKFISIEESPDNWVKEIVKADRLHEDTGKEIKKAGYDIRQVCRKLSDLYKLCV